MIIVYFYKKENAKNFYSSNKDNILLNARYKLYKIFTLLYGRQAYRQNFIADIEAYNFRQHKQKKRILFPNEQMLRIVTNMCVGFLTNEDPPVSAEKYQLMPGLKDDDVILITYNNVKNMFETVELVEKLHTTYIDLMFPKSIRLNLLDE